MTGYGELACVDRGSARPLTLPLFTFMRGSGCAAQGNNRIPASRDDGVGVGRLLGAPARACSFFIARRKAGIPYRDFRWKTTQRWSVLLEGSIVPVLFRGYADRKRGRSLDNAATTAPCAQKRWGACGLRGRRLAVISGSRASARSARLRAILQATVARAVTPVNTSAICATGPAARWSGMNSKRGYTRSGHLPALAN